MGRTAKVKKSYRSDIFLRRRHGLLKEFLRSNQAKSRQAASVIASGKDTHPPEGRKVERRSLTTEDGWQFLNIVQCASKLVGFEYYLKARFFMNQG